MKYIISTFLLSINFLIFSQQKEHKEEPIEIADLPINNIAKECTKIGGGQEWNFSLIKFKDNNYKQIEQNELPHSILTKPIIDKERKLDFIPYHHFSYFKRHNISKLYGEGTLKINTKDIKNVEFTIHIDSRNDYLHSLWYVWYSDDNIILAIHEEVNSIPVAGSVKYSYYSLYKENSDVLVYPNPVVNQLRLSSASNSKIKNISIVNSLGVLVSSHEYDATEIEMNVSQLKKGSFTLNILLEKNTKVMKSFIKL